MRFLEPAFSSTSKSSGRSAAAALHCVQCQPGASSPVLLSCSFMVSALSMSSAVLLLGAGVWVPTAGVWVSELCVAMIRARFGRATTCSASCEMRAYQRRSSWFWIAFQAALLSRDSFCSAIVTGKGTRLLKVVNILTNMPRVSSSSWLQVLAINSICSAIANDSTMAG